MPRKVHRCLVWTCKKSVEDNDILYHKLTNNTYEQWMKALGRNPDENLSFHNFICSKHFIDKDYSLKNGKRILKANAVPTVNLPLFKNVNVNLTAASTSTCTSNSKMPSIKSNILELNKIVPLEREVLFSAKTHSMNNDDINENAEKIAEKKIDNTILPNLFVDSFTDKTILSKSYSSSDNENPRDSLDRRKRDVKMTHNYCLSLSSLKKNLIAEKISKKNIKIKFKYLELREKRLRKKVNNMKTIIYYLKKKSIINEDVTQILQKTLSGIPLAVIKRMLNNVRTRKISTKEYI